MFTVLMLMHFGFIQLSLNQFKQNIRCNVSSLLPHDAHESPVCHMAHYLGHTSMVCSPMCMQVIICVDVTWFCLWGRHAFFIIDVMLFDYCWTAKLRMLDHMKAVLPGQIVCPHHGVPRN